jgi:hypothetical protein
VSAPLSPGAPDGEPLHPGTPDPSALRRRVLLTGLVTLSLYLVVAFFLAYLAVPDLYLLPAVVLLYLLVVRPLMRPVREASALRRRLAHQAYRDARSRESADGPARREDQRGGYDR